MKPNVYLKVVCVIKGAGLLKDYILEWDCTVH